MEEELKPKLRFNNFENPWQQSLLMDQVEIRRGLTYKPSDVRSSGVRVLRSSNIVDDTFILSDDDVFVDKGVVNIPKVSNGDILVTAANGSTKLVGKHAILKNLPDDEIVVHGGFMLLFKTEQNYFVNAWMSSNEYKRVLQFVQGGNGAIGNLSSTVLKSMKMSFPSVQEQSAIGSLFRTLDKLLASYKDNLANYQSLKATMLSKMFPKAGQTVPEIRLDGFEGEWEEKSVGELADIVRGSSPRPIQDPKWFDSNSEIGWLRISDVTNQNGRIHSLEQKISKLGQEKTRVLIEPHLLLSIAATVGKPVVNYVKTGVHDGFLIFMNPKFDREFMFQWLEMFREKWNRYGQPGSQVNLNSDIVKNQKILIPSMEEQRAIGSYISNLDNLIVAHQEKITQLEDLKKKLLQDMFI